MLAEINIIVSWGAVAVIVSLLGLYLGTLGTLLWKFVSHTNDINRHLTGKERFVSTEKCDISHKNSEDQLNKQTAYIGDVENRITAAHKELKEDINKRFDKIEAILVGSHKK
jgi:hypothetical protein